MTLLLRGQYSFTLKYTVLFTLILWVAKHSNTFIWIRHKQHINGYLIPFPSRKNSKELSPYMPIYSGVHVSNHQWNNVTQSFHKDTFSRSLQCYIFRRLHPYHSEKNTSYRKLHVKQQQFTHSVRSSYSVTSLCRMKTGLISGHPSENTV